MVYMLFDNPADKEKTAFLNDYETASIEMIFPERKCNTIKEQVRACQEAIHQSTTGDTIICWYDFMGVICWWLCKIEFKKRQIIVLNILLKDKNTLKNKLAKYLYKTVLQSDNAQATVTSEGYGRHLNNILGIQKSYTLLRDLFLDIYAFDYKGEVCPRTVFCGGRNGRDWELLMKIAQTLPEITFNCVMPREKFDQYKDIFSKNIQAKVDIPEKDYLELMCQSQLVVMPLETEAPAGLIGAFQAAANGKMIIISDTVTTQEYFSNGRGALCNNDVKEWQEKIDFYLSHQKESKFCVSKLKKFLEEECSQEKFAETLMTLQT